MSDGPIKMAPDAPPLDDIILGDDDQTVPTPPVHPRSSAAPHALDDGKAKDVAGVHEKERGERERDDRTASRRERSSNRVKAAEPTKEPSRDGGRDTRKRQKMTLRIPDDEVSRPQLPSTTPMGGVQHLGAATSPSRPPPAPEVESREGRRPSSPDLDETVATTRNNDRGQRGGYAMSADDTLELPAAELEQRGASIGANARRAPGIDTSHEAGWTPFQPAVAERRPDFGGERIMTRGQDAAAAAAQAAMRDPALTMVDEPGHGAMGMMMQEARAREETPSSPPPSEDIPIDTDDDDEALAHDRSDELTTNPRLPVAADSEEIKLDDGERHTDPGEVPDEIAPEDLVSVESIPNPHSPHAPPPLKGGAKHGTASPPLTATALMAGVGPTLGERGGLGGALPAPLAMSAPLGPSGVTPLAPSVATKAPGSQPPAQAAQSYVPVVVQAAQVPQAAQAPQVAQAPANAQAPQAPQPPQEPNPAAGTPMARRQQPAGGPFGFMPQVGALAPPAMNESAAHRKKTRPWWEDLFNDDFIRTMAKITDADISREANFIEESLGCEAGATILDLACGTGRHAVELATRGYQVVGFDLSLAMLARASDEAQDRKQKINFVQGDMREMTFEETFDGVFSWNTSFGYFDEEKNATVIAKVHRALKKGGQFLLDVVNRDNLIRSAPSLAWFEGDGCICMDEMQVDFITSRMKVKRTLMMDDGRTKEIEYSIRIYSLHELGKMLHDNGFRVAEVSGRTGTPGVFFGCESPRTLILAEKR